MAVSDGLDRMRALLAELGNPERDLKVIHIAGTNGKGSTAVMIASILEAAGYKTGLFTSPHLISECERIQIWDGSHRMISQEHLDELRERIYGAFANASELHVFEVYTAAAYCWFEEEKVDYAVLECGLGGRLDSTNTIEKPLATVITHISLDHTAELGNTVIKIANEKAGIIKPGVPVVSQSAEMMIRNILRKRAAEKGSEFIDASAHADEYRSFALSMKGEHQLYNAAAAAEAVRAAGIDVSADALGKGLAEAVLPGRFEVIGDKPYIILDGAHNPDAVEELCRTFSAFAKQNKIKRTRVIFGCMKDKNYIRMIQLMTGSLKGCSYAAVSSESSRSEDPEALKEVFENAGRKCICYDSVRKAFDDSAASNFECILITGSIYLVGAARDYLLKQNCIE